MNRILSVCKISFKKTVANFPVIISGTLIIVFSALLLVYGLYLATGSGDMSKMKVDVGVFNEDTSDKSEWVFNYVANGSSVKDLVSFIQYEDTDSARAALRRGDVAAYSHVPEGFFRSVTNGTNTPLKIFFDEDRDNPGIGYFLDIIDATAVDVALSQASIYAAEEIGEEYGMSEEDQKKINTDLNNIYFNSFLNRESMYDTSFAGSAKGLTLKDFYVSTLILLILMLSGVSFISVLRADSHEILSTMKRSGFPLLNALGSNLSASLLFTITIEIIYEAVEHSIINPLGIFLVCYSITAFNALIYRLIREDTAAMLVICSLTFLLLFLSGAIIPISFMPDIIIDIGRLTHAGIAFETLKAMTVSLTKIRGFVITAVYGALFTAVSVISDYREVDRS